LVGRVHSGEETADPDDDGPEEGIRGEDAYGGSKESSPQIGSEMLTGSRPTGHEDGCGGSQKEKKECWENV
jgi:hypothetical protein